MDERTTDQKLNDTALRSEHRTIGHRMSRKVLVIAPTNAEAQAWAHHHGIAYSDTIFVGPINVDYAFRGVKGLEHVILGWSRLDEGTKTIVKEQLELTQSVPFEGESHAEPYCTDPVRG